MTKRTKRARILVVEDEMLIAMMLEDVLVALGYAVVGPFGQLETALAAAESESLDAALLDINLGGKPVYPAAEALVARGLPFAFVTGYGDSGVDAAWAQRPILDKPFRKADVELLVNGLLERPEPT